MTMLPTAIMLRNYRCFAAPVRLELRPITLLYGVNNAGKTALLRALPLLAHSLDTEHPGPLSLESEAARGCGFKDLRWKGPADGDRDLGIAFSFDGEGPNNVDFALTWFDEGRRPVVRRLVASDHQREMLEATWVPHREQRSSEGLSYELRVGEKIRPVNITFRGLLPTADEPESDALLAVVRRRLISLRGRVQWLAATRHLPENRLSTYPSGPRGRLLASGRDVGGVLATQPDLLGAVSSWYERNLQRRLDTPESPPGRYRLVLRNLLSAAEYDIDLVDTGEGMVQVLPVLTALALSRSEGGPSVVACEEPESHLHPALQQALAEEFCTVAANNPRVRLVLETHSEHLLLGVQLQIVRGVLDPDQVLVYWVHQLDNGQSIMEPITFDRDARPIDGMLPPGVFSEDTQVAREIIRARVARSES